MKSRKSPNPYLRAGQFICIFVCFQACVTPEPSKTTKRQENRAFLWEARQQGVLKAYFFGTIHVGASVSEDINPIVLQKFRAAPCFVMESDLSDLSREELFRMSRLQEGELPLDQQLSPATWVKLQKRLSPPLSPAVLRSSKAWFAALLYMQSAAGEALPEPGKPMDLELADMARAAKKRLVYLEEWRSAIEAFAKSFHKTDLEKFAQNEPQARAVLEHLVEVYKRGQENELVLAIQQANANLPNANGQMEALLIDRNRAWLPKLKEELKKGPCFVAVGSGHLVGEGSLRSLLSDEGVSFRRLP